MTLPPISIHSDPEKFWREIQSIIDAYNDMEERLRELTLRVAILESTTVRK